MLMEQIAGAQAALEADIELLRHAAMMGGDGAALAAAQNQMSRLSGLQHRIESAEGGGLAAIRAEVMASVAASQTLAQQARASVSTAQAAEVALHEANAEAHRVTGDFVRDFYERKIFDKYLEFDTDAERRAYCEREEARHRAIEEARTEGTPEGELRALHLSRAQLEDAGAHGADQSPEYRRQHDRLTGQERNLSQALEGSAASIDTPDDGLASSTRALVPPDIVATLRLAGTSSATEHQNGHGLPDTSVPDTSRTRV